MTLDQKEHRAKIAQEVSVWLHKKYQIGAEEHNGLITDLSADELLEEAINEAIDQCVYLFTLKGKLKDLTTWTYDELLEFRNRINYEIETRYQKELSEDLEEQEGR